MTFCNSGAWLALAFYILLYKLASRSNSIENRFIIGILLLGLGYRKMAVIKHSKRMITVMGVAWC